MKCLECKSLDLKSHPAHAKTGFGQCKKEKLKGVFVSISFEWTCPGFEAAKPDLVAKRIDWYEKEKEKWTQKHLY